MKTVAILLGIAVAGAGGLQGLALAGSPSGLTLAQGGPGYACFYEGDNYSGDLFCLRAGEEARQLRGWDDRISSVHIIGPVRVRLYSRPDNRGGSTVISCNLATFRGTQGGWNDQASSIRVEPVYRGDNDLDIRGDDYCRLGDPRRI